MSAQFCGTCGTSLAGGAAFCAACGTPVGSAHPVGAGAAPSGQMGYHPVQVGAPPQVSADRGFPVGGAPEVFVVGAQPTAVAAGAVGLAGSSPHPGQTGIPEDDRLYVSAPGGPMVGAFTVASAGSRLGAVVIDGLIGFAIEVACWFGVWALVPQSTAAGLLLVFGGLFGYLIVLLVMMARSGTSPGKAMVGIRVVHESSGGAPGFGIALGRYLLRSIFLTFTFYIAAFSVFWDSAGLRRAWWDRAVGTVVLQDRTGVAGGPPVTGFHAPGAPAPPAPVDPGPSWAAPPPAPASTPSPAAPAAGWNDRPSRPVGAPVASVGIGDSGAGSIPWAEEPAGTGQVVAAIPGFSSKPASVAGAAAVPPVSAPAEHTRLAPSALQNSDRGAQTPRWSLEFDNGDNKAIAGALMIGRDPSVQEGGPEVFAFADESRSVSKAHVLVEVVDGELFVTDRHSTNGVAVIDAGLVVKCEPGVPSPVPDSATVRFGDREFRALRI